MQISKPLVKFFLWKRFFLGAETGRLARAEEKNVAIFNKILIQTTQDVRLGQRFCSWIWHEPEAQSQAKTDLDSVKHLWRDLKMATKGASAYSVYQQYSSFSFLIPLEFHFHFVIMD